MEVTHWTLIYEIRINKITLLKNIYLIYIATKTFRDARRVCGDDLLQNELFERIDSSKWFSIHIINDHHHPPHTSSFPSGVGKTPAMTNPFRLILQIHTIIFTLLQGFWFYLLNDYDYTFTYYTLTIPLNDYTFT